jgi:hypothetical protein
LGALLRPRFSVPGAALAALLSAAAVSAQTPFIGPRAAAMGGAAVAVADDGTALWTNPAGLARDPRIDVDLFGAAVATDRGDFRRAIGTLAGLDLGSLDPDSVRLALAAISDLAGPGAGLVGSGAAGFVVGWNGLAVGVGDLAYAAAYPNLDFVHVVPGGGPSNGLAFNQTAARSAALEAREARVGYARSFFGKTLLVGVAARYILGRTYYVSERAFDFDTSNPIEQLRRAFDENARRTDRFAFDAGAMVNLAGKLRFGLVTTALNEPSFAVKRDANDPRLAGAPRELTLPRTLRAGAAFTPISALTVAIDGDLIATDTLLPGGKSRQLSAGLEVRLPLFAVRAGTFRDFSAPDPHWAYSAGIGLGVSRLSVNAAVVLSTYQGLSLSSANQRDLGAAVDARFRF